MGNRQINLAPAEGFTTGIGRYVTMLEDVRERTKKYVQGFSSDQLSWHPNSRVESVGTLLLHIAACECSYIQEDIVRQPMGEEWVIAFPIRFDKPQLSGKNLSFYIDKLDEIRRDSLNVLRDLSDADLKRIVIPLDPGEGNESVEYSIEWILYHLVEHEAHHKGQIALMKRIMP